MFQSLHIALRDASSLAVEDESKDLDLQLLEPWSNVVEVGLLRYIGAPALPISSFAASSWRGRLPDMSDHAIAFSALLAQRNSTRRFLNRPLPQGMLASLLALARRAPSGANLQPGEFISLEGPARARLSAALTDAFRTGKSEPEDYSYFPQPMPQSLRRRQVAAAKELYGALQTGRDDREGRDRQFERNFRFFDAPVALLVTIDARMGSGCYMDMGMCLYGLMLAAAAHGVGSCAIGALASYPGLIRSTLELEEENHIVCGVALGYADPEAPENTVRTERLTPEQFFRTLR